MLYLQDKSDDNWSAFCDHSMTVVKYDDGTTKPFTLDDIIFTHGKYQGTTLGELSDVGYLQWMTGTDNQFNALMAERRLQELI